MALGKQKSVRLEDVARAACVSRATVSRVVRGENGVSPDKVAAVNAAVDQLGYRPNRAARSLVTQRTDMVALIVPEPDTRLFSDPFFSVIVNAVNREFEDTHLQLVLMLADRGCEDTKLRPFLYEGHVDGAIITSHHQVPQQIQTLLNAPIPVVFIGRPTQAPTFKSWVDVDNTESGRLGARRLIERGSRRPAIITGPLDMLAARDRLNGYTEVMESFKLPLQVIEGGFTSASGAECAARMSPDIIAGRIDGVYASSDLMAMGAINRWRSDGINVPASLRVVSTDNTREGAEFQPPLTSITNPGDKLGQVATKMLIDLIEGKPITSPVILGSELVERVSG